MSKIKVKGALITIVQENGQDYISLTDMVKNEHGDQLIKNWLKNKNTIEFLGIWERLNNPSFNMVDFDLIRIEAGTNRFLMSVNQWVDKTHAVGIMAKAGRYGGTYAHKDIALHFAMWISPEFQLLVVKEYQALKEKEQKQFNPEWTLRRFLAKVNYRLHTDAIKENIIPVYTHFTKEQKGYIYANEAEMLNVAVFGKTSKQWREENVQATLDGFNIRDLANIPQLTVLSNLENYNSILIGQSIPPEQRLEKLKEAAVTQLKSLNSYNYTYSIDSPNAAKYDQAISTQHSGFDDALKGLLSVPPEKKDKKD